MLFFQRIIYVADLIEEVAVTYEDVMKYVKKGESKIKIVIFFFLRW